MIRPLFRFLLLALFFEAAISSSNSPDDHEVAGLERKLENEVRSETKDVKDPASKNELGRIRFHYDEGVSKCDSLIILRVGTFMSVADYDKLSTEVVTGQATVVVMIDDNVNGFQKKSATKFARLLSATMKQLDHLIPLCSNTPPYVLFGGHSAAGEAALIAWQNGLLDGIQLDGLIGLDPYEISEKTIRSDFHLDIPGLYWGFSQTTCLVDTEKAATAAYERTDDTVRILYTIDNTNDPKIAHCIFTDDGCGLGPVGCPSSKAFTWIYSKVAESIHSFLHALKTNTVFSHKDFELAPVLGQDIKLYVNSDKADVNNSWKVLQAIIN